MLFFNFERLVKESNNNPILMINMLRDFSDKSKLMKAGLRNKLYGHSFLINSASILNDKTTDVLYIYQYLYLASKRDYAVYKLYGIKSLPLSHFQDIKLDSIKHNPLLTITKTEIMFNYEEITNGTSIR